MGKTIQNSQHEEARCLPGEDHHKKEDTNYGCCGWTPACIQFLNNIRWYVLWSSLFSFVQGFIVNGVINAVITSLETRFELPSTRSGLIASSNNLIAMMVVVVLTYYGAHRDKPRIIATGILAVAIGSLVFSIPHFTTGPYNYRSSDVEENVCYPDSANDTERCQMGETGRVSSVQNYLYIFMLGNALHGIGATPMFTLGTAFIDENSKAEMTSWYLGIVYAAASLGVAAGYMAGSQFLRIYTDIGTVDMTTVDITPTDPRWVGAWWVPFLICGVTMLILVLPVAGYPTRLPGSAALMISRRSEAYQMEKNRTSGEKGCTQFKFFRALFTLIKNPTFVFLSLATCAEGNIVSGIAAFGAKFLQEKFNTPTTFAGFLMGIITVPGAGGGMLLGGYLVKRFRLECRGIIRLNLLAACLAFPLGAIFLIHCPGQPMAGIDVPYDSAWAQDGPARLQSACNVRCGCSTATYEPVCGMNNLVYFSPCHAGCDQQIKWINGPMGPVKMYQNCSCVVAGVSRVVSNTTVGGIMSDLSMTSASGLQSAAMQAVPTSTTYSVYNSSLNVTDAMAGAYQGLCSSGCPLLYVMAPLLFVGNLLTFTTVSPTQTATLRCVPESERALAIGLQWLFLRAGGTMPGPLVLGAIIDSACAVWQTVCDVDGTCWVYTSQDMGVRIFAWWLLIKAFSIVCYFCAQHFHHSPAWQVDAAGETGGNTQSTGLKGIQPAGLRDTGEKETVL